MHKFLRIHPELKNLIPPLSPEEYTQLEQNILAYGCRDPIAHWRGIIVDGHNRHSICTKHVVLPCPVCGKQYPAHRKHTVAPKAAYIVLQRDEAGCAGQAWGICSAVGGSGGRQCHMSSKL